MTGIILCGGESIRMGTDKGVLQTPPSPGSGLTWAQITADKLSALSIPVKISVNKKQYGDYSNIFQSSQLVTDKASLKIKGPLCGVLSAHLQYPSEDLIILACDMPFMETEILEDLMDHYYKHPGSEAYVFTNDGKPEPLCGIYTAKGLTRIYDLYGSDQLHKFSMKHVLEQISTYTIPLPDDKKKSFTNFNTQAETNSL